MALQEHIMELLLGPESWSSYARRQRSLSESWRPDLKEAELKGLDLTGADLRDADLRGADLREVTLFNARLDRADLSGTDLSGSDLRGASLSEAVLKEAVLKDAKLWGAKVRNADFSGAVDLNPIGLGPKFFNTRHPVPAKSDLKASRSPEFRLDMLEPASPRLPSLPGPGPRPAPPPSTPPLPAGDSSGGSLPSAAETIRMGVEALALLEGSATVRLPFSEEDRSHFAALLPTAVSGAADLHPPTPLVTSPRRPSFMEHMNVDPTVLLGLRLDEATLEELVGDMSLEQELTGLQDFTFSIQYSQDQLIGTHKLTDELLRCLQADPEMLHQLTPRQFEEFTAEVLQRLGFEVELTPPSKDGGKDIYAVSRSDLGSMLYIVECKKYSPAQPVGVGLIRNLYGVVRAERANAGVLVATSHFTRGAKEFQQKIGNHQLSLKGFEDLKAWLKKLSAT